MKARKSASSVVASALFSAIFALCGIAGIGFAHADLLPVLSCHFQKDGPKGCDKDCTAVFSQAPARSPNNLLEVICDDHELYSGGGFEKTEQFANNPQFGMGIVTAINGSILPDYPSVFVDGDFEDFGHSFQDRAARLYFSPDDYILGSCDHKASGLH